MSKKKNSVNLKTKALFLDRDGVINIDKGHVHKIADFEFIDGIFDLCKRYQDDGFIIIIITNQAGIAKKIYDKAQDQTLTSWMLGCFQKKSILISKVYHCPHHPEFSEYPLNNCDCRKPKSGLFIKAINDFNIDIKKSIAIGDNLRDLKPAHHLGISRKYLISCSNEINSSIITKKFKTLFDCAKFISL